MLKTVTFEEELTKVLPVIKGKLIKLCQNPTLTEDILQDTVEKALKNKDKFGMGTNMEAWLYTIARNTFYTSLRRSSNKNEITSSGELFYEEDAAEIADIVSGMDAPYILGLINQLVPEHQEILKAVGDGAKYKSLSAKLGIAEGTVKSRLNRARETLKALIVKEEENPFAKLARLSALKTTPETPKPSLAEAKINFRRIKPLNIETLKANGKIRNIKNKPEVRWVDPSTLLVDPKYQRDLSAKSLRLIDKIIMDWSWAKFKLPICADTAEGLFVVDGQHTSVAAASHPKVDLIPVLVVDLPTVAEQADAFVSHNTVRIAMTKPQILIAKSAAGDAKSVKLLEVVARSGCFIPRTPSFKGKAKVGEISTVAELERSLVVDGEDVLERLLKIAVRAELAPVSAVSVRALRAILTTSKFSHVAALSDIRIATAIRNCGDLKLEAVLKSKELGITQMEAAALLIAERAA